MKRPVAAAALVALLIALWLYAAGWMTAAALLLDVLPSSPRPLQWITAAPVVETLEFSGGGQTIVADQYRPADRERHPALVFVYGALQEGRRYEPLTALGKSLARAGYVVLNPDLPDLPEEAVTPASLEGLIAAVQVLIGDPHVGGERVGLFGFSLGGALALVAAADARVARQVAVVVDVGGYYRFEDMIQAVTTGTIPDEQGNPVPYLINPVASVTAINTIVRLLSLSDQALVAAAAESTHAGDPLVIAHAVDRNRLSPAGQAVLDLVRNRDPHRVAALYAALDPTMRATIAATMAPEAHADQIRAPVWALHDVNDPFVPSLESRRLAQDRRLAGRAHVTFSTLLQHAELAPQPLTPENLLRVYLPNSWSLLRYLHGALAALT